MFFCVLGNCCAISQRIVGKQGRIALCSDKFSVEGGNHKCVPKSLWHVRIASNGTTAQQRKKRTIQTAWKSRNIAVFAISTQPTEKLNKHLKGA